MTGLLQLIRRHPQSQSLVKAPSADLIRSDSELTLPELYVPKYMDPEEFRVYKDLAGGQFDNVSFTNEAVGQILVKLGIRLYPLEKVNELLNKQLKYYQKAVDKGALQVIWRSITGNQKYESPIPARIIKLVRQLQTESGNGDPQETRYFQGNCDPYGRFIISDISGNYGYRIFAKNKSLICFLAIELFATSGHHNNYQTRYRLIIDAWRGPTFSDEEAKL